VAAEIQTNIAAKGFRLLLVDDNAINQKVAVLTLKKLGYHADIAGNGCEALEALARQRYDLVLMDCIMPEMDGFEATRRLRAMGGHAADVPVIAMTANAFAEDRKACLAAGMTDYLAKPVYEADLSRLLKRWLVDEPVHHSDLLTSDSFFNSDTDHPGGPLGCSGQ
jgi:CheY-like chemotaxis protein